MVLIARMQDRAIWGHFAVTFREPGCRSVWYDPPHDPGTLATPTVEHFKPSAVFSRVSDSAVPLGDLR